MNLKVDHARVYERNYRLAMVLYGAVIMISVIMNGLWQHSLDQTIKQLQSHRQPKIIMEKNKTMENIKQQLTHLFSVPVPGISFSILSFDENGLHVRGRAKSTALLDKWLSHVSDVFMVDMHTSEARSKREVHFEVKLYEKP